MKVRVVVWGWDSGFEIQSHYVPFITPCNKRVTTLCETPVTRGGGSPAQPRHSDVQSAMAPRFLLSRSVCMPVRLRPLVRQTLPIKALPPLRLTEIAMSCRDEPSGSRVVSCRNQPRRLIKPKPDSQPTALRGSAAIRQDGLPPRGRGFTPVNPRPAINRIFSFHNVSPKSKDSFNV